MPTDFKEIKDKEVRKWIFAQQCTVLEIDDDIQNNVRKIVTENPKMIEFTGKSKTDFALDLLCECPNYCVPNYIESGLKWLNNQKVLE